MDTKHKLTKKEQAFIDYYMSSPKVSATQAALHAYNTTSPVVAASIGYENLRKPQIKAYMMTISELAEETVLQLMRDWGDSQNPRKRELAVRAAMWSHDKVYGRATTKLDVPSSIVRIAIDLSGNNEEPPADLLD